MTLKGTARAFYRLLQALSDGAGSDARAVWAQLDPKDLSGSWASNGVADQLLVTVAQAQLAAAEAAEPFVAAAMAKQAATAAPLGVLDPRTVAGVASDGRDLDGLLLQPLIQAFIAIRNGASPAVALDMGANALDAITQTQVSDAGRTAVNVAMTAHPRAGASVRMLVPPSCGRCAVLAGRVYRWSTGFDRHPQDDCVHVPTTENVAGDLTTDPDAYFRSLTPAEQDRHFGTAAAAAIRDGANLGQVVNARRGAAGLSQPGRLTTAEQKMLRGGRDRGRLQRVDVYGRQVFVTTEGTTRRGLAGKRLIDATGETGTRSRTQRRADRAAGRTGRQYSRAKTPRLMPEAILEIAGEDRELRIKLLRRFGYLLD